MTLATREHAPQRSCLSNRHPSIPRYIGGTAVRPACALRVTSSAKSSDCPASNAVIARRATSSGGCFGSRHSARHVGVHESDMQRQNSRALGFQFLPHGIAQSPGSGLGGAVTASHPRQRGPTQCRDHVDDSTATASKPESARMPATCAAGRPHLFRTAGTASRWTPERALARTHQCQRC